MAFTLGEIKYIWKSRGNKNYLLKSVKTKDETVESLIFNDLKNNQKVSGKIISSPKEGEAYHWPRLQHENLAPLLDILSINETVSVYISSVFEKSLKDTIREKEFTNRPDCLSKKKSYAEEILLALDYLHGKSLCLMNLNEANIYVSSNDDKAVITDFSCLTLDERATKSRVAVPALYRAPELAASSCESFYPKAAEMWACGVLMLQIFSNPVEPSFEGDPDKYVLELAQSVCGALDESSKEGSVEECNAADEFKIFLGLFLKVDPCSRTTASNAAISSFLRQRKGVDKESEDSRGKCSRQPELNEKCEPVTKLQTKPGEPVKDIPIKKNSGSFLTLEYVSNQEKLNDEKFKISLRNYIGTSDVAQKQEAILNELVTDAQGKTECKLEKKLIPEEKNSAENFVRNVFIPTKKRSSEYFNRKTNHGEIFSSSKGHSFNSAESIRNSKVSNEAILNILDKILNEIAAENDAEKSKYNSDGLEGMPSTNNSNAKINSDEKISFLKKSLIKCYSNLTLPMKNSETEEIRSDEKSLDIFTYNQETLTNGALQTLDEPTSDSHNYQPEISTESKGTNSSKVSLKSWNTLSRSTSSEDDAFSIDSLDASIPESRSNESSSSMKISLITLLGNEPLHEMESLGYLENENESEAIGVLIDKKSWTQSQIDLLLNDDNVTQMRSPSESLFPSNYHETSLEWTEDTGQGEDDLNINKLIYRNGEIIDTSGNREDLKRKAVFEEGSSSPLFTRRQKSPMSLKLLSEFKKDCKEKSGEFDTMLEKEPNEYHMPQELSDVGGDSRTTPGFDLVGDFASSGDTHKKPLDGRHNRRLSYNLAVINSGENNPQRNNGDAEPEKCAEKTCKWFYNKYGEMELHTVDFTRQGGKIKNQEKSKFKKKSWFHHFCFGCQTRREDAEILYSYYSV